MNAPIDVYSQTWQVVYTEVHKILDNAVIMLQDMNCDEKLTQTLRGEIRVCRKILGLPQRLDPQGAEARE